MAARVRTLTEEDVPAALEIARAAGWNQTAADLRVLLTLAPDTCFAIDCEGKLAATATLLCYGRDLAWVGMVLTREEHRRKGFARLLVTAALDAADSQGVASVKLDATDMGRPLYQSLGFRDEQVVERWSGTGLCPLSAAAEPSLDHEAYRADRAALLLLLGGKRSGARASYVGPVLAQNAVAARHTLGRCDSRDPWYWDVLAENSEARELAASLGFTPQRRLMRMVRGAALRGNERLIYAIAGFEFG